MKELAGLSWFLSLFNTPGFYYYSDEPAMFMAFLVCLGILAFSTAVLFIESLS